uniref:Uncharacterized protein n=1 Tax=Anguilla anguilla TaxID=7936 RepID=A0A0E9XRF1_ANGAN
MSENPCSNTPISSIKPSQKNGRLLRLKTQLFRLHLSPSLHTSL